MNNNIFSDVGYKIYFPNGIYKKLITLVTARIRIEW